MSIRLSNVADSRSNNLRIVRLVAASAVILSHSLVVNINLAALAQDPLARIFGMDSGGLAVDLFFIISGFLVTRSLVRGASPLQFIAARILRIYPGLLCVVLLMALVLGPIATTMPMSDYWRDQWLYRFIAFDSTMVSIWRFVPGLPGVFASNPFPGVVNGSLWSLPHEVAMYATLLVLFVARGMGRAYPAILFAIALLYIASISGTIPPGAVHELCRLLGFFHAGAACYVYRERIIFSWPVLIGLTVLTIVANIATHSPLLLPVWMAYATMLIGYHPRLVVERWCDGPDYSYGIYIYAFPVQQTLIWLFGPMAPYPSGLLALVLTMPFAIASWHLIENPALRLKRRFRGEVSIRWLSGGRMRQRYLIGVLALSLFLNFLWLPVIANKNLRFTYSQTLANWRSKLIAPNSVFLGDSITAGGRGFNRSGDINLGTIGFQTYQAAAMLAKAQAYAPHHIVIMAGTNDAIEGPINLAKHEALWPKICADPRVIVTLAPPTSSPELNQRVDQVNQIVRASCEGNPPISLDALRGPNGLIQQRYTVDGVHLTPPAYAIWRSLLAKKGV